MKAENFQCCMCQKIKTVENKDGKSIVYHGCHNCGGNLINIEPSNYGVVKK